MEKKEFNGFMLFLSIIFTVFFITLKVPFLVAFMCSLMLVMVLRALFVVYSILLHLFGGLDVGAFKDRKGKRFKG